MEEKFFYDWTKSKVWKAIESTFEPLWQPESTKVSVEEQFNKLQGDSDHLKRCILENDAPECLKASKVISDYKHDAPEARDAIGEDYWEKYIKPVLKSLQKEKYRRFNDPIHGTIELHPLLCKIIDTPEFHRLNDIKQLSGVHYVYPNARHTRFEHSIGVCYLAGEFARTLQKKQPELKITDKDVLCVEIAGLIHDLGHGPFSHMFEYGVYEQLKLEYPEEFKTEPVAGKSPKQSDTEQVLVRPGKRKQNGEEESPSAKKQKLEPPKWEHEMLSQKVFKDRICKNLSAEFENYGISGGDIEFITELIHYKTKDVDDKYRDKAFLFQIVANKYCGIDVDKWDYFARDGLFIGVAHDFDFNRLMSMSRVIRVDGKWKICFRIKEMNNIYGMFRTRCSLFQRALHHKVKIAAELMLCRAIALAAKAVEITVTEGDMQTSCTILSAVKDAQKYIKDPSTETRLLDGFLALTDSIIYAIKVAKPPTDLNDSDREKLKAAKRLLHRLSERNLFHEVKFEGIELPNPFATDRGLMKRTTGVLQALLDEQLQDLGPRSVFIQLVDYKYGSEPINEQTNQAGAESTLKWNDPVRKVYFYEKQTPMVARPGEHPDLKALMEEPTTDLVRPKEFSVFQWKVYSDLKKKHDSRIIKVIDEYLKGPIWQTANR